MGFKFPNKQSYYDAMFDPSRSKFKITIVNGNVFFNFQTLVFDKKKPLLLLFLRSSNGRKPNTLQKPMQDDDGNNSQPMNLNHLIY